jgi:Ca2+-binding EF-hand superfamily protein
LSKHPDVIAKRKTPSAVLREFLDTFDVGGTKDGCVTTQEFINYYSNISASIDNDDYFELMIRNAWHISGGEGQYANSTNMSVMVTNSAGQEQTITLLSDLGIQKDNYNAIYKQLMSQGVQDIKSINGKIIKLQNVNGVMIAVAAGDAPNSSVGDRTGGFGNKPGGGGTAASSLMQIAGSTTGSAPIVKPAPPLPSSAASGLASRMVLSQMKEAEKSKKKKETDTIVAKTLLDVLRVQLLSRGTSGIIELQRKFVDMDTDGSKSLDLKEFAAAIVKDNLAFSEQQVKALFKSFGKTALFLSLSSFCISYNYW